MKNLLQGSLISLYAVLILCVPGIMGCGGDSDTASLEQGIARIQQEDYEVAELHLDKAVRNNNTSASAYCNLGIACWKLGKLAKAVNALTMAADLAEEDPRPLELLGTVLGESGRWKEAGAFATRKGGPSPDDPRALTWAAKLEFHAGDAASARAFLEKALDLDPEYGPALYNMGVLHRQRMTNAREAVRYFERFIMLGDADIGRVEKAKRFLVQEEQQQTAGRDIPGISPEVAVPTPATPPIAPVPKPDPPPKQPSPSKPEKSVVNEVAPLLKKVAAAITSQEFDEALVLLNEAMGKAPGNPEPLWQLATLYDKHLKYAGRAEKVYRRFAKAFPDDPRTKRRGAEIGERSTDDGRRDKVVEAVQTRDAVQEAWNAGLRCHGKGDWKGAVEHYRRTLELNPKLSNAAYNLGLVLKAKGDLEPARAAFEQALDIRPDAAKAHYMLAVVHRRLENRDEAILHAKKALEIDPKYYKGHLLLGLLYRKTLRYELAGTHFELAVRFAPDKESAGKAGEWLKNTGGR